MIPVHCRVKHDPAAGTYGDCIRACVASILEMVPEAVPHFTHDDPGAIVANRRIAEFLATLRLAPFWSHYDGSATLAEVIAYQAEQNPTATYMLFGGLEGGGDHVVICKDGAVDFNPAWYSCNLVGPGAHGLWSVMVICRT